MIELRYLAFAVGYRRVSFVMVQHGKLVTWQTSCKAAKSDEWTRAFAEEALAILKPHVVVLERLDEHCRKGAQARSRLRVIGEVADQADAQALKLVRSRQFSCRFSEAAHLATLYPDLVDKVPQRRFFDREPHHVVLFAALALADQAMHGSSSLLASQM